MWVSGSVNVDGVTGIANKVVFDVDLAGDVVSLDPINNSFSVLGREVNVNSETIFGTGFAIKSLSAITLGKVVKVSGLDQADGSLIATRIDEINPATDGERKIEALISTIDSLNSRFSVGTQIVDYTLSGSAFTPIVGAWVEMFGRLDASNIFIATQVGLDEHHGDYNFSASNNSTSGQTRSIVEIEGTVIGFSTINSFSVNDYPIITDDTTLYIDGDSTEISDGARLSVRGVFDSSNTTLVANKVYVRQPANNEIEGLIEAIDVVNSTITVFGRKIYIQASTQFEDSTGVTRRFGIEQLSIGEFVEVRGQYNGSLMTAYRIERDNQDDDMDDYAGQQVIVDGQTYVADELGYLRDQTGAYLQSSAGVYLQYADTDDYKNRADDDDSGLVIRGVASAVTQTSIVIYGQTIAFTAQTLFEVNERFVTGAQFVSAASANSYIEVRAARQVNGDLLAVKVSLEGSDIHYSNQDDDQSGSADVSDYTFEIKGIITSIDTTSLTINSGYTFTLGASTQFETYALIDKGTFINTVSNLINPLVEIKALRSANGDLLARKVELENSDSNSTSDSDDFSNETTEFEAYGQIDSLGVLIQGQQLLFTNATYFELFDRSVGKTTFLSNVGSYAKFEVKAKLNASGVYEVIKIELDD